MAQDEENKELGEDKATHRRLGSSGKENLGSPKSPKSPGVRDDSAAECIVCLADIRQVPGLTNAKATKRYMMTPCMHKFHEHCLRNWMSIRLECPVCRRGIPHIPGEDYEEEY